VENIRSFHAAVAVLARQRLDPFPGVRGDAGRPFSTFETVGAETPARRAMVAAVTARRRGRASTRPRVDEAARRRGRASTKPRVDEAARRCPIRRKDSENRSFVCRILVGRTPGCFDRHHCRGRLDRHRSGI